MLGFCGTLMTACFPIRSRSQVYKESQGSKELPQPTLAHSFSDSGGALGQELDPTAPPHNIGNPLYYHPPPAPPSASSPGANGPRSLRRYSITSNVPKMDMLEEKDEDEQAQRQDGEEEQRKRQDALKSGLSGGPNGLGFGGLPAISDSKSSELMNGTDLPTIEASTNNPTVMVPQSKITTLKVLLLGPAHSGKSTLVRQLVRKFEDGISEEQRRTAGLSILQGILNAINSVLTFMEGKGLEFQQAETKMHAQEFVRIYDQVEEGSVTEEQRRALLEHVNPLVRDAAFQQAIDRGYEFGLMENLAYFLSIREQILTAGQYLPADQDLVQFYTPTISVSSTRIQISDTEELFLVDLGGQPYLTAQWFQHLDDSVHVILFCASLLAYHQATEDGLSLTNTAALSNELLETLQTFRDISNHRPTREVPLVLLLNKKDAFAKEIEKVSLDMVFEDFKVPRAGLEPSLDYVQRMFQSAVTPGSHPFYVYRTEATDEKQTSALWNMAITIARKHFEATTLPLNTTNRDERKEAQ